MSVNLAAISTALNKRFDDQLQQNINRAIVLPHFIGSKNAISQVIQWDNKFGTAAPTTAVISDGANVSVYNADSIVPALLNFGTYHDAFGLTGKAIAAALAAGNPAGLVNLYGEYLTQSLERLAMAIAVDFYSGTGATDHIMGLHDGTSGALLSTGTYATIDRGTYPQWAANLDANGGTGRDLSIPLMRKMARLIYTNSGFRPDFVVADPIQFEKYGELLGDKRRYLEDVTVAGRKVVLDGGFRMLEFDGIPVVEDINHTAGSMTFGKASVMDIQSLPSPADQLNKAMGEMPLKGTEEAQFGETELGLRARVQPLAINGDLYNVANYCYPQIRVRRPNATGWLKDLNS